MTYKDRVYAFGGLVRQENGKMATVASVERFDPVSMTWTPMAPMKVVSVGLNAI